MNADKLQRMADKLAIRSTLDRYCHGMDRADRNMAEGTFFEDATVHYYDLHEGTAQSFVDWAWQTHAGLWRIRHQIDNLLIELDGDTASSEAYVTVVLWTEPPNVAEVCSRGRYLDHWRKQDGHWRITHREHVLDTQTVNGKPNPVSVNEESTRDSSDPSARFIKTSFS